MSILSSILTPPPTQDKPTSIPFTPPALPTGKTGGQTTPAFVTPSKNILVDQAPIVKAITSSAPVQQIVNTSKAIGQSIDQKSISPFIDYEKQYEKNFVQKNTPNMAVITDPKATPDAKKAEMQKLTDFVLGFIGGPEGETNGLSVEAKASAIEGKSASNLPSVIPNDKGVVEGNPRLTLANTEKRVGVTPTKIGDAASQYARQSEKILGRPVVLTAEEKRIVNNGPAKPISSNQVEPKQPIIRTQIGQKQITPPTRSIADLIALRGGAEKAAQHIIEGNHTEAAKDILDLSVDEATQGHAMLESTQDESKKGIKSLSDSLRQAYEDWVNTRSFGTASAYFKAPKLAKGLPDGIDTILNFQDHVIKAPELRRYFDTKFRDLNNAGVNLNYRQDYLPQLWNNTPEEIAKAFGTGGRKLGLKPSFTMPTVFDSYAEGIKAGLTPKFTNIKDLIQWYEKRTQNALADKNFFKYLVREGLIQPKSKAPIYWQSLDPDHFPMHTVYINKTNEKYSGVFSAPPNLARVINNYLKTPDDGALAKFAQFASFSKNIVLSFGIPKTAVNAHGFNILARNILASKNPLSAVLKGTAYMLNPNLAEKALRETPEIALDGVKHGLVLSTEDHVFGDIVEGTFKGKVQKLTTLQRRIFEDPLFNRVIPALKTQYYAVIKKDLLKTMSDSEAGKQAASTANSIFGGINYDMLARNKETRKVLSSLILAPDWAETNINIGSGVLKGSSTKFNDPKYKAYRTFARNFLFAFIGMNIANYVLSGHMATSNDPGHTFDIESGKYSDGSKRYIHPFGTAVDFARLPYEFVAGLTKGDLSVAGRRIRNRLSPVLGSLASAILNVDQLGRPVFGKDKYGKAIPAGQQVGSLFGLTAGLVTPPPVTAAINVATGKSTPELGLENAFELPFSPGSKPPKTAAKATTRMGGGILGK